MFNNKYPFYVEFVSYYYCPIKIYWQDCYRKSFCFKLPCLYFYWNSNYSVVARSKSREEIEEMRRRIVDRVRADLRVKEMEASGELDEIPF